MTRQEFIDALGRALRRELSEQEVEDNLRYYETYISQEMSGGKSEAEVIAQLGDPRLIAKTILEVDQQREEQEEREYSAFDSGYPSGGTVYTEDADGNYEDSRTYEDYGEADGMYGETDGMYGEAPFEDGGEIHTFRAGGWKLWLILAAVLFVVFCILGTMFAVLWRLLPFLVLGAVLVWIYRRFFS